MFDEIQVVNIEQSSSERIIFDEKKDKWLTWLSILAALVHKSIEESKIKTQLKVDAFQSIQPKESLIPHSLISQIGENSPM